MSNSVFIVSIVLMTIVSPIFNAKMVYSITCGMAKDSMRPCLVLAPGQVPTRPCCDALQAIEFQATTKQIRQFYCNCFKNVIHSSPYVKLIPLPELCRIPITGILTPPHGCDRLCHQELGLRLWDEELPTPTIEKVCHNMFFFGVKCFFFWDKC
ncbi:unnamed protein product [Brassica napus]|uniref:(rape) hypothetical protein n=1 Tax=Brassica napus TaxID=3708 RepID=A0A816XCN1_BRANA|nr:unnamed protein product [Brassica napus]